MPASLTNVQLELLKLYSTNLSDTDLLELKQLLSKFFADKSIKLADEVWNKKGYTNDQMENLLNDDGQ
jgi:hypothetical protein